MTEAKRINTIIFIIASCLFISCIMPHVVFSKIKGENFISGNGIIDEPKSFVIYEGNIFLLDSTRIQKFNLGGDLIDKFGFTNTENNSLSNSDKITTDGKVIYVVKTKFNEKYESIIDIDICDLRGKYIKTISKELSDNNWPKNASALRVKNDILYVLDKSKYPNTIILISTKTGEYVSEIKDENNVFIPAFDIYDDKIYIPINNKIYTYNLDGTLADKVIELNIPDYSYLKHFNFDINHISVSKKHIYLAISNQFISKYNHEGKLEKDFSHFGSNQGEAEQFQDISFHKNKLFILDYGNNRINVFDENGNFEKQIGSTAKNRNEDRFESSHKLSLRKYKGYIYAADPYIDLIYVINSKGEIISQIRRHDIYGTHISFIEDWTLANDKIYISNSFDNVIQIYTLEGKLISHIQSDELGASEISVIEDKIYISNKYNNKVKVYTEKGDFLSSFSSEITAYKSMFNIDSLLYISDCENNEISIYDNKGHLKGKIGKKGEDYGEFLCPSYLSKDNKILFVLDSRNERIQLLNSKGKFIKEFIWPRGSEEGELIEPNSFAVLDGLLFITDSFNYNVQVFNMNSEYIKTINIPTGNEGNLLRPEAISIFKNMVYVGEKKNKRIQIFNNKGELQRIIHLSKYCDHIGSRNCLQNIKIHNNNLYMLLYDSVVVFDLNGKFISKFGVRGANYSQLEEPYGIDIYKDEIYISDQKNNRIQVFDLNGKYKRKFGHFGHGNGELHYPKGILVKDDFIYVVDSFNNRIQKYSIIGKFIKQFGHNGSNPGEFNKPSDITIKDDCLYITDSGNNRVQVFSMDGKLLKVIGNNMLKEGIRLHNPIGISFANDNHNFLYISNELDHNITKILV